MYRTIVVASIYEYTDKDKLFGMVIASLYDKFCEAYENNSLTEMFPTYEGQEIKKNLTFQRICYVFHKYTKFKLSDFKAVKLSEDGMITYEISVDLNSEAILKEFFK